MKAAFPVRVQHTPQAVMATEQKKTFTERKIPKLISHYRSFLHPQNKKFVETDHKFKKNNWPGILSLVCSVMAFAALFSLLPPLFFIFSISGVVFGIIGLSKKRHTLTGLALAGLILGGIELSLVAAMLILFTSIIG